MPNLELHITLDDRGAMNVNGAIENKLIAFGLLELAKEAINGFHAEQARKIQPASAAERLALVNGGRA